MADLTFSQLQVVTGVTEGTFFLNTDGKVCIDVSKLIGEDVLALTTEKATETVYKLARLGRKAQETYNNALTTNQPVLSSFSTIGFDRPAETTTGDVFTVATITVNAKMPIDANNITGVTP